MNFDIGLTVVIPQTIDRNLFDFVCVPVSFSVSSTVFELSGTVSVDTLLACRQVVVLNRSDLALLFSTHSGENGKWKILTNKECEDKSLLVLCRDSKGGNHNAQVFDFVSQKKPSVPVEEAVTE